MFSGMSCLQFCKNSADQKEGITCSEMTIVLLVSDASELVKNKDLNIPFGLECVDRNVEQSQKETWKAFRKSGRE